MNNTTIPQVIIIMTDTQRKDMVSCYGNPAMRTPNLDRLASEGVRFENAYCCQPVCGPARAAFFTGTFPHSNGVWANSMPLGQTVKTVGQRLSDNGIHCGYIGKWHLEGGDYFGMGRCPEGWDPAYGYDMRNYLEELSPEDRRRSRSSELYKDPSLTAAFTFGHRCSNRAIDFLNKYRDKPFLLVVSYDEPHGPCACPKPYSEMFKDFNFPVRKNVRDTFEKKPEHQQLWAGARRHVDREHVEVRLPHFFGCNAFIDSEIGRVLESIDQKTPNALVIYTSDHGDALESHGLESKGPAMYDELTNVPFIVRWPGHVPAGVVSESLLSHVDVAPTLADVFETQPSGVLEGHSLVDVFRAPEKNVQTHVFMEFGRYEIDHDAFGGFQPVRAVRNRRYKLVVNLLTSDELYDLENDPEEMENLIDSEEHAQARDALHNRLLEWMNATRDPFRGYYWERRPWRKDARPATWDYTGMTRQREEDEAYEPRQLDYDTGLPMVQAVRGKECRAN